MTRENRSTDEFMAVVHLDPTQKYFFKFVVDGVWRCSGEFPTASDPAGNVNNWRVPSNEPPSQFNMDSIAGTPVQLKASMKSGGNSGVSVPVNTPAKTAVAQKLVK